MANNKIKYGIKNVYYAPMITTTGGTSYSTPVAMPGAVSISLEAQGDLTKFYADNSVYWMNRVNMGYEGSLELAHIPNDFRTSCLGERVDDKGMLVENNEDQLQYFALLFEIEGDDGGARVALYKCMASRPALSSQTAEESPEPIAETIDITAAADDNGFVRGTVEKDATNYTAFFDSVHMPGTFAAG